MKTQLHKASAGLAILAAGLTNAGCSNPAVDTGGLASPAHPTSLVSGAPAIQTADGLSLPIEQYLVKTSELHTVNLADAILTQQCMEGYGFSYPVPSSVSSLQQDSDPANMPRRYGLSDASAAARWGYELPPTTQASAPPATGTGALSDAEYVMLWGHSQQSETTPAATLSDGTAVPAGGCKGVASRKLGDHGSMSAGALAQQIDDQSFYQSEADSPVVAAIAAWSRCMATSGYTFKTPFDAMGAFAGSSAPSQAEINQAVTDVGCKKKTDLLGIWDADEGAIQDKLIEQNHVALTNGANQFEELIKYAESVIS